MNIKNRSSIITNITDKIRLYNRNIIILYIIPTPSISTSISAHTCTRLYICPDNEEASHSQMNGFGLLQTCSRTSCLAPVRLEGEGGDRIPAPGQAQARTEILR
jgi:hypothetical protein